MKLLVLDFSHTVNCMPWICNFWLILWVYMFARLKCTSHTLWSCSVSWHEAEGCGSGDQCYPVGPCDSRKGLTSYVGLCTGPSVAGRMVCIVCTEWCASCVIIYFHGYVSYLRYCCMLSMVVSFLLLQKRQQVNKAFSSLLCCLPDGLQSSQFFVFFFVNTYPFLFALFS